MNLRALVKVFVIAIRDLVLDKESNVYARKEYGAGVGALKSAPSSHGQLEADVSAPPSRSVARLNRELVKWVEFFVELGAAYRSWGSEISGVRIKLRAHPSRHSRNVTDVPLFKLCSMLLTPHL